MLHIVVIYETYINDRKSIMEPEKFPKEFLKVATMKCQLKKSIKEQYEFLGSMSSLFVDGFFLHFFY